MSSVSRMRSAAARPDWSAVTFWLSSLIGSIRPNAYSRNAMREDTASSPSATRQAPRPRIAMMASWMPEPAIVQASASRRTARTPCSADARASAMIRSAVRSSARLTFTVRMARSAPSSAPPSRPMCSCARFWAVAIPGISTMNSTPTSTTATRVVPSSTRSRTAIRTSVPASMTVPLIRPISAPVAASRSSTVSEVTRVTSSPGGRRVTAGTVDRRNRRTIDARACRTTRSPRVPSSTHCQYQTAVPSTSSTSSPATGRLSDADPPRASSTHLVTIGVARPIADPARASSSPRESAALWGRANDQRIRSRGAVSAPEP